MGVINNLPPSPLQLEWGFILLTDSHLPPSRGRTEVGVKSTYPPAPSQLEWGVMAPIPPRDDKLITAQNYSQSRSLLTRMRLGAAGLESLREKPTQNKEDMS